MQVRQFYGFVADSANYFTKEHDGDADFRCDNKCAGRCWHHDYPQQPSGALKEPDRMLARVACLAPVEGEQFELKRKFVREMFGSEDFFILSSIPTRFSPNAL